MKQIILEGIGDIVIRNNCDLSYFMGVTVLNKRDINGKEYQLEDNSEKYLLAKKFSSTSIFLSESCLLNMLLGEYINEIESGNIYEHGYPESRLIPSNHMESCQNSLIEQVTDDIYEKIIDILRQYF